MFKNLNLFPKLLSTFLVVGIIPTIILSTIFFNLAKESLEIQSYRNLDAVREIKTASINRYLNFSSNQISHALRGSSEIMDLLR